MDVSINDIGANISVPISLIVNFKLHIKATTQSLKLCYASCHAELFGKAKACHQNRLDSVARSVKKLYDKTRNKVSGCGAVGSALPHTVETTSSSFVTQTK